MSGMNTSHYTPAARSERLPSPPRTNIPPLGFATTGVHVAAANIPDFLLPYDWSVQSDLDARTTELYSWSYENRRQAQLITPFLYLGPIGAAKDAAFLQQQGITMVFATRGPTAIEARIMSSVETAAQTVGVQVEQISVKSIQNLRSTLPSAVTTIRNHLVTAPATLNKLGKVLVICETGNERSAAVVVAFLMAIFRIDLVAAAQVTQAKRFSINVDDELKTILTNFYDYMEAQRMVGQVEAAPQQHNGSLHISPAKTPKRGRDMDEDEDNDAMSEHDDRERFAGRSFAPFSDDTAMGE